MMLKFKTITETIFGEFYELFTRKFIPVYKIIILRNLLLELYQHFYLVFLKEKIDENFRNGFLFKMFFIFRDNVRGRIDFDNQNYHEALLNKQLNLSESENQIVKKYKMHFYFKVDKGVRVHEIRTFFNSIKMQ